MALPGFELLYGSLEIRNLDDATVAAVHWNIISNGFKCCGTGETWPTDQSQGNIQGSESLPAGWNADSTLYCLRYVDPTSNRTYLMKALAIDGNLNLNFLRCFDEKAASVSVKSRDFVNTDLSTVASAYSNLAQLNTTLTSDLVQKVNPPMTSATQSVPQASRSEPSQGRNDGRSPLMEPPRHGGGGGVGYMPPRMPARPMPDPFGVGRADLDPLGGPGGGGMFMDPRSFPRPGMPGGPGGPGGPGFPPGAVPPGARFDPVGPFGMRQGPDPDHERPPDSYDDMFM